MKTKFIFFIAIVLIIFPAAAVKAENVFKIGADVTIEEGMKVNNVIVIGGQITVTGLVENNVVALGGSVVLTSKALVRGNVVCIGGVIARGSGAQVFGKVKEINSSNISAIINSFFRGEPEGWSALFNIISLYFQGLIFILALLAAFIIPRPLTAIKQSIQESKIKSFFWGLLATLMITPFFILLVISIAGIYLIPVAFTALLMAFILGYIAAAALLGDIILTKIAHSYKKPLIVETILGLILLLVIGWIPYIGWLIKVFVVTSGLGGVLLVLFNRRHRNATL
ncbi:MAG: hypothetical protein A2W27_02785 [Deltaproteobacteria bacterium RBG_16_44_11]|nr:MAG: hypothetical protein A2W27_02785 [Deltaproteobacteria bacterium RBG_16_44_11]